MIKEEIIQFSHYEKISPEIIEKEFKHAEKIIKFLKSNKTTYEKKISLFNWLKSLDVGKYNRRKINGLILFC